jgi:uncharacterized membrane-anchored protein
VDATTGARHGWRSVQPVAAKVPEITALFWLIKVVTTGMGEATSDYLGGLNLVLAGAVGVLGIVTALALQLRADRYRAPTYWFAVVMVAVFGTMAADGLHVGLGVPYAISTAFYAVVLALVFWLWQRSEHTLSIHTITTRRRETYYWITVLATFALGTAAGDFTATSLNLGFFTSAMIFGAAILVPALGWWRFGLPAVPAFWITYVLTRPLGASIADWLGKSRAIGGLALGDGTVSGAATLIILVLVTYVAVTERGVQSPVGDTLRSHPRPQYVLEPSPSADSDPDDVVGVGVS